jgi:hypothetical protein
VIEVRVCQENVTYRIQVGQRKITNTGAGVDQHIVVDEHCGGARTRTDSATATKHANSHPEGFS